MPTLYSTKTNPDALKKYSLMTILVHILSEVAHVTALTNTGMNNCKVLHLLSSKLKYFVICLTQIKSVEVFLSEVYHGSCLRPDKNLNENA